MLLVLDIGNTNTVVGVYEDAKLLADWRLATDRLKTVDEYGILVKSLFSEAGLDHRRVESAIISSVVPPVTGLFAGMIEKYFGVRPREVGPGVKTGLVIKYENPREVGADRVVNAVAGIQLYGPPLVIIDFGTATTFCAIGAQGDYLGGSIAPGLGIISEALFIRTAKLPRVEIVRPRTVIGKNTVNSIQSGLFFGYIGMVESLITRIKAEMNCNPLVVATGGLAELIAGDTKMIDRINPYLTLEGLRLIYGMNQNA
ncbi:pantothenate kinase [Hydrogenispora ethanolica]|uniref:Type III pantothenate kinase n=1 Tax=Hydrogenispora ethanolica TaxID=1082276 RepID=A0A4R1S9A8_HYDET|nr:type III pantothenate kinase [Hydrogenispora ethanolica]TCL75092.1 pantothenate kinase [Hydrogenispora ethanolica]